jgi:hypothetical protein
VKRSYVPCNKDRENNTGPIEMRHHVIGASDLLRETLRSFRRDVGHGISINVVGDHQIRWHQIRLNKGEYRPAHQSPNPKLGTKESQEEV